MRLCVFIEPQLNLVLAQLAVSVTRSNSSVVRGDEVLQFFELKHCKFTNLIIGDCNSIV